MSAPVVAAHAASGAPAPREPGTGPGTRPGTGTVGRASDDGGFYEAVGVFATSEQLEAAISALSSAGFDRTQMSLLGADSMIEPHVAPSIPDTDRAADDPDAPRATPVSETDVRQGRTLAASMAGVIAAFIASGAAIMTGAAAIVAVIGAAAVGGGATLAVNAVGRWIERGRETFLREQVARGGILLWVTATDPERAQAALGIMTRHGAQHAHLHPDTADAMCGHEARSCD